MNISATYRMV